jgi:DNA-directed RNA polymerase specialized sigma24 family protein
MMIGLDLSEHYEDVVRLVTDRYGDKVDEIEDFVHEVCVKILKLNQGSSPYSESRSQPSTYICMVAHGVWLKKINREVDPREDPETRATMVRVGSAPVFLAWDEEMLHAFEEFLKEKTHFEDVLPRRVFLLLRMGFTRKEIVNLLGETLYQVKKQKRQLEEWASGFITSSPRPSR